jgi:hypothetical protein
MTDGAAVVAVKTRKITGLVISHWALIIGEWSIAIRR